jgi:hypothetical protein
MSVTISELTELEIAKLTSCNNSERPQICANFVPRSSNEPRYLTGIYFILSNGGGLTRNARLKASELATFSQLPQIVLKGCWPC